MTSINFSNDSKIVIKNFLNSKDKQLHIKTLPGNGLFDFLAKTGHDLNIKMNFLRLSMFDNKDDLNIITKDMVGIVILEDINRSHPEIYSNIKSFLKSDRLQIIITETETSLPFDITQIIK